MGALPLIAVAGVAFYVFSRKKKRKKKAAKKALPPSDFGDVFLASDVDKITAKVGERFSVDLVSPGANAGYTWSVSATPPGEPIKAVSHTSVSGEGMGAPAMERHTFDAKKKGSGSLVFHYQRGWEKGQAPPQQIAEIQVEVS